MYKLTYDSDENDEINAPSSKIQQSSPGSKMKADVKESKEATKEASSPKEKKNPGAYEGNGRYYSLFANDDFLTEDKSEQKRKFCRIGIKSILLIVTVILLVLAVMALMWVVRGMQVEQDSLKIRISKLEDASPVPLSHPIVQQAALTSSHRDAACCSTNREEIGYLDQVLKGHESRFHNMEDKIQSYRSSGDVRDAQISRNIAQNAADVRSVTDSVSRLKSSLAKVQKSVEAAKIGLFGTDSTSLTAEQVDEYLRQLEGTPTEGTVFAVAHAMGSSYVKQDSHDGAMDDDGQYSPPIVYDVSPDFSPVLSFTENLIKETGEDAYTQPESGTFTIRESGKYFLSVSFCVQTGQTTVQVLRNGEALREFTAGGNTPHITSNPDAQKMRAPPGFDFILNEDEVMAIPPLPSIASDSTKPAMKPYQFNDIANLKENDELQMKIVEGILSEYTHFPGTNAAKSCTRFSAFKL